MCGNGVVEPGEQCDGGSSAIAAPSANDACCTSACMFVAPGTECDDNNAGTSFDVCEAGVCSGRTERACTLDCQCRSNRQCLTSRCDQQSGRCTFSQLPVGSACNDNDECTTGDACTRHGYCGGESSTFLPPSYWSYELNGDDVCGGRLNYRGGEGLASNANEEYEDAY